MRLPVVPRLRQRRARRFVALAVLATLSLWLLLGDDVGTASLGRPHAVAVPLPLPTPRPRLTKLGPPKYGAHGTGRAPNRGWDRARSLRMGKVGEPADAPSHRPEQVHYKGGAALHAHMCGSLFAHPYIADVFLDPVSGCVRTVTGVSLDYPLTNVTLAFGDPSVYTSRGKGEAAGSPLAYDRITLYPEGDRLTTGEFCAPALVGAQQVTLVASLDGRLVKYPANTSYQSLPFIVYSVPLPPVKVPLAMCSYVGTELALLPAWVEWWAALGVGHFFLHVLPNELAGRPLPPRLLEQVDAGLVTLIDLDVAYNDVYAHGLAQPVAIASCIARYKGTAERLAFFDSDEFVVLGDAALDAGHTLLSWLDSRPKKGINCVRLPSQWAVATHDKVSTSGDGVEAALKLFNLPDDARDAAGYVTLPWLVKRAVVQTATSDWFRTKCIVRAGELCGREGGGCAGGHLGRRCTAGRFGRRCTVGRFGRRVSAHPPVCTSPLCFHHRNPCESPPLRRTNL